jgi:hypothetical protein
VSPAFFSVLGIRLVDGREFTDADHREDPVAIVSRSLAQRFFPNGDALNRHLFLTDSTSSDFGRIVGVVPDVEDEHLAAQPTVTIYRPVRQFGFGGRLFVRTALDPHTLVPAITRTLREIAADQPVERAATLEEVRAEQLTPDRVNALVFSGFAGIALLIAVVGIAGVLAFSVSARTREFGLRLAVGCSPRALLTHVLSEGTAIAVIGIGAGAVGGFVLARVATSVFAGVQLPGALAVGAAAFILLAAALVASWLPAARASRIDVIEALRSGKGRAVDYHAANMKAATERHQREQRSNWICLETGGGCGPAAVTDWPSVSFDHAPTATAADPDHKENVSTLRQAWAISSLPALAGQCGKTRPFPS